MGAWKEVVAEASFLKPRKRGAPKLMRGFDDLLCLPTASGFFTLSFQAHPHMKILMTSLWHPIKTLLNSTRRKQPGPGTQEEQENSDQTNQWTYEALWDDVERRTHHYAFMTNGNFPDLRLLNWIGSMDSSGYTRETCLKYLIIHFQEGDENRILLRLTDWVPNVRGLAVAWATTGFQNLSNDVVWETSACFCIFREKGFLPRRIRP